MNGKNILILVMVLCFSMTVVASASDIQATDYSKARHWLSLPASADKKVDVFYLYPSSWTKVTAKEPNVCSIDNPIMLVRAKTWLDSQATAFETVGNIYAPYYRQDDAQYALTLSQEGQAELVGGIPKTDVFAAFDYYINNYNHGRPFILAGHSQGSTVMALLLSEYMKAHPDVYARMIAAYVIGYSITGDYLKNNPHLKFAAGPDDTGVIISYNTEAPGVVANPMVLPGAIAINPITWTRDGTLATAQQSLGSRMPNKIDQQVQVKDFADGRIDLTRGVLVCSTVDVNQYAPGNQVFGKGIYHHFDYQFYYYNIRENAENRTKIFLSK
ncbi:MAG: DUF3089 domain-containing protein [Negativicutes bacterium]|nr:DUF3089 domain-containing protein [Negativicutes bacterium]